MELNKAEVDFKAAIENGDAMQIAQTDESFHEIIYNSTKNQKLVQILNNLREQMYRYRLGISRMRTSARSSWWSMNTF